MPTLSLNNIFSNLIKNGRKISITDILYISNYFGVSFKAVLNRLKQQKMIKTQNYDELAKIKNINKIKQELGMKWEFFDENIVYSERLRLLILQAINEGLITVDYCSKVINISKEKLKMLSKL